VGPRRFGISLIELLVALLLAGILVGLAVPSFAEQWQRTRLVSSTNSLLASLHHARTQALLRGEPWQLCLSSDGRRCQTDRRARSRGWLVQPQDRGAQLDDPGGHMAAGLSGLRAMRLHDDIRLAGSRLAITYWPVSRAGTTATLTLCLRHSTLAARAIIVSQTGRPRLALRANRAACPADAL
jgi:type IV fimbrial biogenesis protein FimT